MKMLEMMKTKMRYDEVVDVCVCMLLMTQRMMICMLLMMK